MVQEAEASQKDSMNSKIEPEIKIKPKKSVIELYFIRKCKVYL
jgi:hypothetical protein